MDIYTKIFLANIVCLVFMAGFDSVVCGDSIENTPVLGHVFGLWALASIVSIPVFVVWQIATF